MFRKFAQTLAAGSVLITAASPAADFDSLQARATGSGETAVLAYLSVPMDLNRSRKPVQYGFALTAPAPDSSGPVSVLHARRLVDLRFSGRSSSALHVGHMTAWDSEGGWRVNAAEGEDSNRTVWIAVGAIALLLGTLYMICQNEANEDGKKDCG